MRRTADNAAQTRTELLRAALLVMQHEGWKGATFDRISTRAGVTRGALNHHFADKSALLVEALGWGWAAYGEDLLKVLDAPSAAVPNHLATEFTVAFAKLLSHDEVFSALASVTVAAPAEMLSNTDEKSLALAEWQLHISRSIMRESPVELSVADRAADALLTYIQGLTVVAAVNSQAFPSDDVARVANAIVNSFLGMDEIAGSMQS